MKIGDRFRRTHSLGSVLPHYQRGYESRIVSIDTIRGIPSIRDTNGYEHYVSYIEIIRDPLAEIDDLRAEITALRDMLLTPYVGCLYHDTVYDTRSRVSIIDKDFNRVVLTDESGSNFTMATDLSRFISQIHEGRYVRIPG